MPSKKARLSECCLVPFKANVLTRESHGNGKYMTGEAGVRGSSGREGGKREGG